MSSCRALADGAPQWPRRQTAEQRHARATEQPSKTILSQNATLLSAAGSRSASSCTIKAGRERAPSVSRRRVLHPLAER
jgi:hypothetical protein